MNNLYSFSYPSYVKMYLGDSMDFLQEKNNSLFLYKNVTPRFLEEISNKNNVIVKTINNKIHVFSKSFLNGLRNLFTSCFISSENYFDSFIADFDFDNLYYKIVDNEIVSAFYLVYKDVKWFDKEIRIPYIMGAATSDKHRYKGFFREIFEEYFNSSEDPFCLLSPDIFDFYERFGFKTILYLEDESNINIEASLNDVIKIYNNKTKDMDIYIKENFYKKDLLWKDSGVIYYKDIDYNNYRLSFEESSKLNYHNGKPYIMARIVNNKKYYELTKCNSLDFFSNVKFIFTDRC